MVPGTIAVEWYDGEEREQIDGLENTGTAIGAAKRSHEATIECQTRARKHRQLNDNDVCQWSYVLSIRKPVQSIMTNQSTPRMTDDSPSNQRQ